MNFALVIVIIGLAGASAVDTAAPGNATVAPTTAAETTAAPTTEAPPTAAPTTPAIKPTAAKPTDPPKPIQKGIFHLDKDNTTCILLQLGARITDGENVVDLPNDATVSGSCGSDIILTFGNNNLRIPFVETNNKLNWEVRDLIVSIEGKSITFNMTKDYQASMDNSFSCKTKQEFKNGDSTTLILKELKVQPFMNGGEFGRVKHCDLDKAANNVVPIAVGAALALLVIIVLVLYLIGRRKHQKGYQTV